MNERFTVGDNGRKKNDEIDRLTLCERMLLSTVHPARKIRSLKTIVNHDRDEQYQWVPKTEPMCGMCSTGYRTFSASEITCSMRQCTMHRVELCRSSAIYYLTVGFLVTDSTPPAQLNGFWLHAIVLPSQVPCSIQSELQSVAQNAERWKI